MDNVTFKIVARNGIMWANTIPRHFKYSLKYINLLYPLFQIEKAFFNMTFTEYFALH